MRVVAPPLLQAGCVARTEVFSVKREVSLAPDAIPLEPGKYVLVPLTYSPASRGDPPRQCWLSVFTKSRLYPATMLSDAEIAYDDPTRPVEVTRAHPTRPVEVTRAHTRPAL